ncbi:MAG: HD-GYP domain-containing protein, partial [Acidiferrobacter sp.]
MSKLIDVHDLQKGMYVSKLDRPWTDTPFLFQGFEVYTDEQIVQLQNLCQHVYIESELELAAFPLHHIAEQLDVGSAAHTDERHAEILRLPQKRHIALPRYTDLTTLEEEIPTARTIELAARDVIYTIMNDVSLNRSVDSQRVRDMIAGMVGSITRNPDALIWLTHLRNKDEYTALHSIRVAIIALAFGRHLDLSIEELNILGIGALLHDIGKLRIPNEILNKPGNLT